MKPLLVIVGPTGSGKSELALRAAAEFGGEVVNCDSIQLYRYLEIGSAKVPPGERRGIPHHLIDVLDPDEVFTAGEYARRARAVLADITARGRLPIVAGGTGFYLRALLEGLFPGPGRDQTLRGRLAAREANRTGSLHRLLHRFDPAAAARIHANDVPKVMRALEVCLLTWKPITELFQSGRDRLEGYTVAKIGLFPDRDALYARLERRTEAMFAAGLVEEVRGDSAVAADPGVRQMFEAGQVEEVHGDDAVAAGPGVRQMFEAGQVEEVRGDSAFAADPGVRQMFEAGQVEEVDGDDAFAAGPGVRQMFEAGPVEEVDGDDAFAADPGVRQMFDAGQVEEVRGDSAVAADPGVRRIFEAGLVEEVRGILARGFPPESKALESLGYRQALQVIRGELTVKQAVFYTQRDTRRYAKRQMTWFRREPGLHIYRGFGTDTGAIHLVRSLLRGFPG